MKKLISFSLFLGIILILIAAKSVDAQGIPIGCGRPGAVAVPVIVKSAYRIPVAVRRGYAVATPYPGRVFVGRPWHRHRPVVRVRVY